MAQKRRGLQRVLPAPGRDQATADKHDASQAEPQAQFAQGIGDPHPGAGGRIVAGGAAWCAQVGGDAGASFGMARHDQGQQVVMLRHQSMMHGGDQGFLAGMGAGGEPNRAVPQQATQAVEFRRVRRQVRGGQFQVSRVVDLLRAKPTKPFGVQRRARLHMLEGLQKIAGKRGRAPPARVATLRQAGVQQEQRDPALAAGVQLVGPQLGFHEAGGVRAPMVQEAPDPAWHVQGREAVRHAARQAHGGQAFGEQGGGCQCARGQQDVQVGRTGDQGRQYG